MASMRGLRGWGGVLVVAGLLGGSVLGILGCSRDERPNKPAPKADKGPDAFGLASQRLLPEELAGVYLGMDSEALQKVRPASKRNTEADEGAYLVYDEHVMGSRAVYQVRKDDLRLEKVQLASSLKSLAEIAPRLQRLQKRYGPNSGIWDCPRTPSSLLPTRRFTWIAAPWLPWTSTWCSSKARSSRATSRRSP